MSTNDPMFWIMIIIAASFVLIAVALISMAVFVGRAVKSVNRLEARLEPLVDRVTLISEQGKAIAIQGKEIAEQFNVMSGHLSTATQNFSESVGLIRDEVRELKTLVGHTAETARDKVELVSRTIDQTHEQVHSTTAFIQEKVIEPARELAAIMVGFRKGLEVLIAPSPKPINQTYAEDEMFIG